LKVSHSIAKRYRGFARESLFEMVTD
jgi:hypothetical protein